MTREAAATIVSDLDSCVRGYTASDYIDSIDTSNFMVCTGASAEINWRRIEEFAYEVAIRTLIEYVEGPEEVGTSDPPT